MAATDIVGGTDGTVSASGFNGDIDAWSMAIANDSASWRTFASLWKKTRVVSCGATGQFTGTIQFGAADTEPMSASTGGEVDATAFNGVTLTLTATDGCTYTGTANITGINVNRPSTDRMTGTWNFEFDGAPSQTWDTGT